jgi:hypothetical protein
VLYKKADEITQKPAKDSAGNYFYQLLHREPLIPFLWGNITGVLFLGLIFIFTQH